MTRRCNEARTANAAESNKVHRVVLKSALPVSPSCLIAAGGAEKNVGGHPLS
jgi:hypothetical protein